MIAALALVLAVSARDPRCVQGRDEIFKQDIEEAIKKLGSERYTESFVAREELAELGRRVVPYVVAELNKKDLKPSVKRSLCEILGAVREPSKEAVAALVTKLKDPDEYGPSIASAAARALASIGDESAIPALLEVLKSRGVETDKVLKYECIRAMGLFRVAEAVELLRKALEDKKPATVSDNDENAHLIASAAADALGLIRAKEAVDDLGKLLAEVTPNPSSGQSLGFHAARALKRILEPELRGKTEKEDARAGSLAADPEETKKTLEAWKSWWEARKGKKDVEDTKARIAQIAQAVEAFKKEQGEYPMLLEHLKVKPEKAKTFPKDGYYQGDLKDAWNRDLKYRVPGTGADFDVFSYGKDGSTWGGGDNADLYNHDKWIAVKREENRKKMDEVVKAIEQFKADNDRYPDKIQDLFTRPAGTVKKWPEKGYLQTMPLDAYNHVFIYHFPSTAGAAYDLISYGADNLPGGTGPDEDLWNHDKRPSPPKEEPKKDDKKDGQK
jgi:general secretion pathway protein G